MTADINGSTFDPNMCQDIVIVLINKSWGELTSKATRWQRLRMQQEYDVDAGSATYGRKLDLQCRVGEYELNNSEFKVESSSEDQVEVRYRRNLRINQAMMPYLKHQISMPLEELDVLALDVHGMIGSMAN
ncbi:hypothetical protein BGZ72_005527 [Mortierella alpina]|nr:hypothetical protein BGZ72_005527 [Mortierella alpina]